MDGVVGVRDHRNGPQTQGQIVIKESESTYGRRYVQLPLSERRGSGDLTELIQNIKQVQIQKIRFTRNSRILH